MARFENSKYIMMIMLSVLLTALSSYSEGRLFKRVAPVYGLDSQTFTTYDINRTGDGFIWFATDHGLIRFDGEHSVKVDIPHSGEGDVRVNAVAPINGKGLIAATSEGIYRIEAKGHRHEMTKLLGEAPFPATCALAVD